MFESICVRVQARARVQTHTHAHIDKISHMKLNSINAHETEFDGYRNIICIYMYYCEKCEANNRIRTLHKDKLVAIGNIKRMSTGTEKEKKNKEASNE